MNLIQRILAFFGWRPTASEAEFTALALAAGRKCSASVPAQQAADYRQRFFELEVQPLRAAALEKWLGQLVAGRKRYEAVERATGVPWWVVGLIHGREGSFNFKTHLHNGDPLSARTTHVPKGRPVAGNAPFTFEQSAADALAHDGLATWKDWTLCGALYALELFNGLGYRKLARPIPSPYLWSWAVGQPPGKFVRDGVFSATAVDKQPGVAVALNLLVRRGIVTF